MVPIEVVFEIVTEVAALLFVNVAVVSGTSGFELQFVPCVHSLGFGNGAVQVPLTCAVAGTDMPSAPTQTLASSVARNPARAGRSEVVIAL
jgi:hypothetical protein